ncbi:MAG: response regulator [Candidatus Omnitrophica bacterium]|nr:response regulator [Candidatus Omnitrophota bacterium]
MPSILVVDSKKEIRDFAERFLKERNFEVFSAGTGEEAVDLTRERRPDIVLLEISMEGMGGLNVLRRIREVSARTKVIVVSKVDDTNIMDEAKRLGVTAYLTKPILLNQLLDVVTRNMDAGRSFFKLKVETKEEQRGY